MSFKEDLENVARVIKADLSKKPGFDPGRREALRKAFNYGLALVGLAALTDACEKPNSPVTLITAPPEVSATAPATRTPAETLAPVTLTPPKQETPTAVPTATILKSETPPPATPIKELELPEPQKDQMVGIPEFMDGMEIIDPQSMQDTIIEIMVNNPVNNTYFRELMKSNSIPTLDQKVAYVKKTGSLPAQSPRGTPLKLLSGSRRAPGFASYTDFDPEKLGLDKIYLDSSYCTIFSRDQYLTPPLKPFIDNLLSYNINAGLYPLAAWHDGAAIPVGVFSLQLLPSGRMIFVNGDVHDLPDVDDPYYYRFFINGNNGDKPRNTDIHRVTAALADIKFLSSHWDYGRPEKYSACPWMADDIPSIISGPTMDDDQIINNPVVSIISP